MRFDRILALIIITLCLVAAVGNWLVGGTPRTEGPRISTAAAGTADIALFPIRGTIASADADPFGDVTPSADDIVKGLRRAEKNNVRAILLQINSPGGSAAASQEIYDELMRVREETDIPIVASFGDVAASGGYYIACAANHIVSNPSTITGSIGVIIQSIKVFELFNEIGMQAVTVKSGQYKDLLSPFRETTEAERELLQSLVDSVFEQFLEVVVIGRDMPLEELRPLADGRIFTGAQALELGLVDSLGNYSDAIAVAAELADIAGEPKVQNYLTPQFPDFLTGFFASQFRKLLPIPEEAKVLRWNKVPLTLMT
jgi:protease-4